MFVLCVSSGTMPEANFVVTLLVDLINHLLGYVVEENVKFMLPKKLLEAKHKAC